MSTQNRFFPFFHFKLSLWKNLWKLWKNKSHQRIFTSFPHDCTCLKCNFFQLFYALLPACNNITETENQWVISTRFVGFLVFINNFIRYSPLACKNFCAKSTNLQQVSFPAEWKYWYQPFFHTGGLSCREK